MDMNSMLQASHTPTNFTSQINKKHAIDMNNNLPPATSCHSTKACTMQSSHVQEKYNSWQCQYRPQVTNSGIVHSEQNFPVISTTVNHYAQYSSTSTSNENRGERSEIQKEHALDNDHASQPNTQRTNYFGASFASEGTTSSACPSSESSDTTHTATRLQWIPTSQQSYDPNVIASSTAQQNVMPSLSMYHSPRSDSSPTPVLANQLSDSRPENVQTSNDSIPSQNNMIHNNDASKSWHIVTAKGSNTYNPISQDSAHQQINGSDRKQETEKNTWFVPPRPNTNRQAKSQNDNYSEIYSPIDRTDNFHVPNEQTANEYLSRTDETGQLSLASKEFGSAYTVSQRTSETFKRELGEHGNSPVAKRKRTDQLPEDIMNFCSSINTAGSPSSQRQIGHTIENHVIVSSDCTGNQQVPSSDSYNNNLQYSKTLPHNQVHRLNSDTKTEIQMTPRGNSKFMKTEFQSPNSDSVFPSPFLSKMLGKEFDLTNSENWVKFMSPESAKIYSEAVQNPIVILGDTIDDIVKSPANLLPPSIEGGDTDACDDTPHFHNPGLLSPENGLPHVQDETSPSDYTHIVKNPELQPTENAFEQEQSVGSPTVVCANSASVLITTQSEITNHEPPKILSNIYRPYLVAEGKANSGSNIDSPHGLNNSDISPGNNASAYAKIPTQNTSLLGYCGSQYMPQTSQNTTSSASSTGDANNVSTSDIDLMNTDKFATAKSDIPLGFCRESSPNSPPPLHTDALTAELGHADRSRIDTNASPNDTSSVLDSNTAPSILDNGSDDSDHGDTRNSTQYTEGDATKDDNSKGGTPVLNMVVEAILATPDRLACLKDIYGYIESKYPEYAGSRRSWKSSVRFNLSMNDFFIKSAKRKAGRGNLWGLHDACVDDFEKGVIDRRLARERRTQHALEQGDLYVAGSRRGSTKQKEILQESLTEALQSNDPYKVYNHVTRILQLHRQGALGWSAIAPFANMAKDILLPALTKMETNSEPQSTEPGCATNPSSGMSAFGSLNGLSALRSASDNLVRPTPLQNSRVPESLLRSSSYLSAHPEAVALGSLGLNPIKTDPYSDPYYSRPADSTYPRYPYSSHSYPDSRYGISSYDTPYHSGLYGSHSAYLAGYGSYGGYNYGFHGEDFSLKSIRDAQNLM